MPFIFHFDSQTTLKTNDFFFSNESTVAQTADSQTKINCSEIRRALDNGDKTWHNKQVNSATLGTEISTNIFGNFRPDDFYQSKIYFLKS